MKSAPQKATKSKFGHLILAIWLATVPTFITYGILGLHGLNICRNIELEIGDEIELIYKNACDKEAWETTKSYIVLIGFFITLPTWMWFYLSVKNKNKY
tara:strand:- start:1726 stop:2022 length:297 start_codon:yes stop_codon:yes gene_type:complete